MLQYTSMFSSSTASNMLSVILGRLHAKNTMTMQMKRSASLSSTLRRLAFLMATAATAATGEPGRVAGSEPGVGVTPETAN